MTLRSCVDPTVYGAAALSRRQFEVMTPPIQPGFSGPGPPFPPPQNNVAVCISNPIGSETYVSIDLVSMCWVAGGPGLYPGSIFVVVQPNTAAGPPSGGITIGATPTVATSTYKPVSQVLSAQVTSNNGVTLPQFVFAYVLWSIDGSSGVGRVQTQSIDLSDVFMLGPGTAWALRVFPPPQVPNPPPPEGWVQFGITFSEMSMREARCLR